MRPTMGKRLKNSLVAIENGSSAIKEDEITENVIEWGTFFRRNIEIFVEEILQIKLKPFQRVALHLAGVSDMYMFICSRGLSKSWLCGILAVALASLFPYSEIVITSSTLNQANKMAEKILNEIIKKNSPTLLYMYERGYWTKTQREDGWSFENELNGSTIHVLPALDSSRGSRSTMLIFEEARLIKKNIIDSVFRPMSYPRQAKYLSNPEYGKNERWLEETRSIYLSSACYKYEWLYKSWKQFFASVFKEKKIKYGVFAGDIYTSMENGLKTIGDFNKAKKTSSEMTFAMEDLNEFIGEGENCFFSLKSFKENQVITEAFEMPTSTQLLINGIEFYQKPKEVGEIRIISADFAWTTTKGNGNESDNSVAVCLSGKWENNTFNLNCDYVELLPNADDPDECATRLKRLYWLYQADYIVPDSRSTGETIINALSKNDVDEEYGLYVPARGLGMAENMNYQVASTDKINYYIEHAIDKNYVPCVIPIFGTAALNTAYWRVTKQYLERGKIKFLISMGDKQEQIVDSGEYYNFTSEELADFVAPYGQTDMLIAEAVNLKTEIKNDQIKLTAPRSGHRDRIVTLAMGVLIFSYIENEWLKQEQSEDYNLDDIQLVW